VRVRQAQERVYRSQQLQQYLVKESEVKRLRAHVRAQPVDVDARKAIVRVKMSLFQVHRIHRIEFMRTHNIALPCTLGAAVCVQLESAMRELEAARTIAPERLDLLCMYASL
jgi:hypothetical protein